VVITKLGVMELSERESWERVFLLRDGFGAVHAATTQFAEEREEKKAVKPQQICDVFLLSANYSAISHPLQVIEVPDFGFFVLFTSRTSIHNIRKPRTLQ